VMTTSGLYGTVTDSSDSATITIEIADGVETEWLRAAVREKVGPVEEIDEDDADVAELEDVVEEPVVEEKDVKATEDAELESGKKK
jgi:preprotein translocase subunit YajC